ncbi:MAG: DASH family cryptochrome [Ignavibacteriaceae bacterium]|nr:DASH family cryptochrome [Ignavibacteriaceae bacterium]
MSNRDKHGQHAIYWVRNDLRLQDNEIFSRYIKHCSLLIPVYIFDPRFFLPNQYGFPRTGKFRAKFLYETVRHFQKKLRNAGRGLIVRVGFPEIVIPELARKYECVNVYATKEHAHDEVLIESEMRNNLGNIRLLLFEQATLYHPNELPFDISRFPDGFNEFKNGVEEKASVRWPFRVLPKLPPYPLELNSESMPALDELGYSEEELQTVDTGIFNGGEGWGLKRLKDYIWDRRLISTYKETRNQLLGEAYSTKLSPWLACGALSPRLVYDEVLRFENEAGANDSTYWLKYELLWRDFFRFVTMKYGSSIFKKGGIKNKPMKTADPEELFDRWKEGRTGQPFVDANMHELKATGYMSNRGRQIVASYLIHDMRLDWRLGAAWFESMLIDYDVSSNYGNWMYVAGVGNDQRPFRQFNPVRQAEIYDPRGDYIDKWLPVY